MISNSSNQPYLLDPIILGNTIGQTFNVTIILHDSSSSGINIELAQYSSYSFEGMEEFTVTPNETHSELYVNHFVSDLSPWFNFQYNLVIPEKNASGEFKIEQTHPGYPITGPDQTGDLYVGNITAWLLTQSQTTTSTTQATPLTYSLVIILTLVVMKTRRRS